MSRFFARFSRPRSFGLPLRIPVRGKYDAAQTTEDNRRHWAMADGLSAAAANSRTVRRVLRNRARYEVANNSYAKGIVDTLSGYVVGTGPRLQLLTNDPVANTRVEQAFGAWAREINLAAKLRTMRKAKAVDGEAFAILVTNNALKHPIKLDLRTIEADQVTDPDDSANNADGITFDAQGNPVSYSVLKEHPGSALGDSTKLPPVPASQMIHWFAADRPGQVRGIPDLTPSLPLFAQIRRYTLAVLAAAETAADFAAVMYTNAPAAGEADEVEPFLPIEIEQRSLLSIPAGWQMSQLKAEQPATTYVEYIKALVNEAARPFSMPLNIALCNSAGYNYSSGQLDHQTFFKAIALQQDDAEIVILAKLLAAWLDEAALIPGLLPPAPYSTWFSQHRWFWDGQEHADPTKQASAQETRLRNHTTTLADEYAREGKDWEVHVRQRAREIELMDELGLSASEPPSPALPTSGREQEQDEEQEDGARAAA